eukprot:scaffold4.g4886.t1
MLKALKLKLAGKKKGAGDGTGPAAEEAPAATARTPSQLAAASEPTQHEHPAAQPEALGTGATVPPTAEAAALVPAAEAAAADDGTVVRAAPAGPPAVAAQQEELEPPGAPTPPAAEEEPASQADVAGAARCSAGSPRGEQVDYADSVDAMMVVGHLDLDEQPSGAFSALTVAGSAARSASTGALAHSDGSVLARPDSACSDGVVAAAEAAAAEVAAEEAAAAASGGGGAGAEGQGGAAAADPLATMVYALTEDEHGQVVGADAEESISVISDGLTEEEFAEEFSELGRALEALEGEALGSSPGGAALPPGSAATPPSGLDEALAERLGIFPDTGNPLAFSKQMCLMKALTLGEETGHARNSSSTHLNICAAYSALRRYKEALTHAERAIILLQLWAPGASFHDGLSALVRALACGAAVPGSGLAASAPLPAGAASGGAALGPPPAEWSLKKALSSANVLAMAYHNAGVEHERLGRTKEAHVSFTRRERKEAKAVRPEGAYTIASKCLGARTPMATALSKALRSFLARHPKPAATGAAGASAAGSAAARKPGGGGGLAAGKGGPPLPSKHVRVRQTSPPRTGKPLTGGTGSRLAAAAKSGSAASLAGSKSTGHLAGGSKSGLLIDKAKPFGRERAASSSRLADPRR